MDEIKISIIIPVYNTKKEYLTKCLDSVVNQTIKEQTEIIIVDDGSNESTANICDDYAKKYKNVQVIHQKNQGLGQSRNNGMKKAKGKWIMFVDSDDWIESDICKKLLEADKNDVDIIVSSCNECFKNKVNNCYMFNGKDMEWSEKSDKDKLEIQIIARRILKEEQYNAKYFMVAWAKLYRREFIVKNKLYNVCNLKFREDNIFSLYCFEYARKIVYKNYCLYNYRQCEKSLIHTDSSKMIEPSIKFLKEEKNFLQKYNKPYKFYEAHYDIVIHTLDSIVSKYIYNSNISYKEKKKQVKEIVKNQEFREAIEKVNTEYLTKYLKVLVFCFRKKLYNFIFLIFKIQEKRHKNRGNMYE